MVVLVLTIPNPIIILIAVLGVYETYRRFRQFRSGGEEVREYYAIARRDRIMIGATYLVLIIALVVAMDATHLQRTLVQRLRAQRPASRRARWTSRSWSLRLSDSRLSKRSLPLASAISTLARESLKYRRVGTSVRPRSIVRPEIARSRGG